MLPYVRYQLKQSWAEIISLGFFFSSQNITFIRKRADKHIISHMFIPWRRCRSAKLALECPNVIAQDSDLLIYQWPSRVKFLSINYFDLKTFKTFPKNLPNILASSSITFPSWPPEWQWSHLLGGAGKFSQVSVSVNTNLKCITVI